MTLGHGERLLVTFVIPVAGLVLFSEVPIVSTGTSSRVDFFAPSVLALAVMSSALVSLSIATGFERSWSVLKRLRTTPLKSVTLVEAKVVSVLVVEALQVVVLVAIAYAIGWHPHGDPVLDVAAGLLGTAAFAGIGLTMAGMLRAEVVLALANSLYLLLLATSGIMFPLDKLGGFAPIARLLPSGALSEAFHLALGRSGGVSVEAFAVLGAWALLAPAIAVATFRFE